MAIYNKAPFKTTWEFLNSKVSALFQKKELLDGIESQLSTRIFATNNLAKASGLKPGQLYYNSTDQKISIVV